MTFVYESVEISSFLMFMNSRLLVAFIQTFHSDKILKITLFFVYSCSFGGNFTNSWSRCQRMEHDNNSISLLEPSFS